MKKKSHTRRGTKGGARSSRTASKHEPSPGGVIGKCPHCGELFQYEQSLIDTMAEAALDAVARAAERRQPRDCSTIIFNKPPAACTGSTGSPLPEVKK